MKHILIKLLLTACLLSFVSPVLGAEIESVKIGWDGNYRIGYWCPVKVNLKTDKQYDGELVFKVDNVTYIHPVTIPVSSTRVIDFDIVINSLYPEIGIRLSGRDKLFTAYQPPKAIPAEKTSIGVEQSVWEEKGQSFIEWSQTQYGLFFFPFKMSELPETPLSYEAVDQLIFSTSIKKQPVWAKLHQFEGNGYVYIQFVEDELTYDLLTQTSRDYIPMESIFPSAYQGFDVLPWTADIRKILLGFLPIYALIAVMVTLLFIWIKMKNISYIIFIAGLIACVIIAVVLLYSVYLPSDGVSKLNITGDGSINKYDTKHKLIMVYNQFNPKGLAVKFSSPYYKPIYKEKADKTLLTIRFNTDGGIGVEMPLGTWMIFEHY